MTLTWLLLLLAVPMPAAEDAKPAYPRSELLLEAADLAKPRAAERFVILDTRDRAAYLDGHLPDAAWLDEAAWKQSFKDGQDRDDWAKRIGALGIDGRKPVVIYGLGRSQETVRMWWILRYWGVRDVRLLNGGWSAWRTARGTVEKGPIHPRAVDFKPMPQSQRLSTKGQILERLKDKPPQIVDARSRYEYCGTAATAKRNGAIPGAVHLEWIDTFDKTGRFKSAKELEQLLKDAGIDPKKPAITYCQTGGRASVMAFVLELMGGDEVRNYYHSWAQWGNDEDTPIVKPERK